MFADGRTRIVNIKGIRMDAEFGASMVYVTNYDKPGFIGKFSSTLGDAGISFRGISAHAIGKKFLCNLVLDTAEDADRAAKLLKKL